MISIDRPVFSCVDTNNPSVYIDMETEMGLARVTLWASHECDMEAVSKVTGQTVISKYVRIDENNYQEEYANFLYQISSISH